MVYGNCASKEVLCPYFGALCMSTEVLGLSEVDGERSLGVGKMSRNSERLKSVTVAGESAGRPYAGDLYREGVGSDPMASAFMQDA